MIARKDFAQQADTIPVMSNHTITLHLFCRDSALVREMCTVFADPSCYEINFCQNEEDLFASLILTNSRQIAIYELPDPLNIPDTVLQRHAVLTHFLPLLCIGQEEMPLSGDYYELPIEFLGYEEVSPATLKAICRNLLARSAALTALKNARSQITIQQEQLADSELGLGLAHDASNMLTATLGNLQLLQRLSPDSLSQECNVYLDSAVLSCRHLKSLLEEWKNQTSPHRERRDSSTKERLLLSSLLSDLESIIRPIIPEHITFKMQRSTDGIVFAKRHQLEQVILNLILNSIQATPYSGEILISVDELSYAGDRFVTVSVKDTGTGIPKHILPTIFNPYCTTKGSNGGVGVGLAMVNRIIHEHGGQISVESTVGRGTTISIQMPLFGEEQLSEYPLRYQNRAIEANVLVIDDTLPLLQVMEEYLEDHGLQATTFTDSRAALDWTVKHTGEVDLVLMDLNMPGMSGRECFYRCRSLIPNVPIAIYSGEKSELVDELLANGAVRFFEKPMDYEAAVRWIKETIHKSRHATGSDDFL